MSNAFSSKLKSHAARGAATKGAVLILAVSAAVLVGYIVGRPPVALKSSTPPPPVTEPTAPALPPSPEPILAPSPTPMPAPVEDLTTPPAPALLTPDLAAVAANPAWWPKSVQLTHALNLPVYIDGKPSGQVQVPAGTTVRLVRVLGQNIELEYVQQRATAPATATNLLALATVIARQGSGATPSAAVVPTAPPVQIPVTTTPPVAPATPAVNKGDRDYYRKLAAEVTDDIHDKYWMKQSQRYSNKPGGNHADAVWGAGVMFSALVGATRHDGPRYEPLMRKFYEGLNGYWDTKAKIAAYEPTPTQGGNDKYYDDNAWMVITFFEAYELTRTPRYRQRAEETLDFVLSGWDEKYLDGGIWWHEAHEKKSQGKNTCANGPSAVACLLSAKFSQPTVAKSRIEWAQKIVTWTQSKLQLSDGLYADSIGFDGKMNRDKLTYNAALMLRANLGLYRVTKKPEYLAEAQKIGKAGDWFVGKDTGAYRDAVKWAHLMVEADLELYRATHEEYLLTRAKRNADHYYEVWKNKRPDDLIDVASIARTLWLMADTETEVGRKFWEASDADKLR